MKIGIVAHNLTKPTGAVRVEIMQAKILKQRGHEAVLYTMALDRKKCYPELLKDLDIQIIKPGWRLSMLSALFKAPSFVFRYSGFPENLDCVIAHSFPQGFMGMSLKRHHGTNFILFFHGIWGLFRSKSDQLTNVRQHSVSKKRKDKHRLKDRISRLFYTPIFKVLEKKCIQEADIILTQCLKVSNQILETYKSESTVIPLGIEYIKGRNPSDLRKQLGKPELLILTVTRIRPAKGIRELIRAYRLCTLKNTKLVIVGPVSDKHYYDELLELVKTLNLQETVLFTGAMSGERLATFYEAADFVVYTPFDEPYGLVPLEAMLHGTPSIVSEDSGVAQELGPMAVLVDPNDIGQLASKMVYLGQNRDLRLEMGRKGKDMVKSMTWDRHGDELEKIILRFKSRRCE
jgi:glycosyltransferase involved in cell wall biosynthesis